MSSVSRATRWTAAAAAVQQDTLGHRGRAGDPLYKARRTLHTGASLLTEKQHARLEAVLAYFDRPGTSNGPTEAINGRLEHLRGSALGFRNLTHYIARSLLEAGGFRPALHP
jgi:transposase